MVKTDMAPPHYNFKYDGDGGASKKTHIMENSNYTKPIKNWCYR